MDNNGKSFSILTALAMIFVSCLIISNILAAKMIKLYIWSVSAGVLVFPISYIVNDVVTEVYGFQVAKKMILFGFAIEIAMVLLFQMAIWLPSPEWFENDKPFAMIVGNTPRTAIASLLAYLSGSLINAIVMDHMKLNSQFKTRAIISTLFGELTDSLVFVPIAFLFLIPFNQMIAMIFIQVILKTFYEILILPITGKAVKKVRVRASGIEQDVF